MVSLASKPNVNLADPNFGYGTLVDDTGSGNGTPVSKQVYSDHHQFFERLMDDADLAANGLLDNDTNGYQLNDALAAVTKKTVSAEYFGAWTAITASSIGYGGSGGTFSGTFVAYAKINGKTLHLRYVATGATTGSAMWFDLNMASGSSAYKWPGDTHIAGVFNGIQACSVRLQSSNLNVRIAKADLTAFAALGTTTIEVHLTAELA